MFSFNRNEQIVILLLAGTLLVGSVVQLLDHYLDGRLPDFEVRKAAVLVPTELSEAGSEPTTPEPIDLNRATAEELDLLPRIGPQTATRIIDHHESFGPFQRVEDLEGVRGIGRKAIEKLIHLVVVSAP